MIAKIGHGSKIYSILMYNYTKVLQDNGEILHLNNMLETRDGQYTTGQLMTSFLPYLAVNKKTEKTAVHISLNPNPNDYVSNEDFIKMAEEYMNKMLYGEQPYVVFKHNDIDRTHIHIVTTSVDKDGIKIPDSFERKRSMEICRQIEQELNLTPATEKQRLDESPSFSPVHHAQGNIKSQIAAVVRYLPKYYNFQNLGGYNALLSLFNITAEHVKKDYNDEIKEGLVYFALDESGNKISNPFKSSLFGKQAGISGLRSHFEKGKNTTPEIKAKTSQIIVQAMSITTNEKDFKGYLIQCGINTVIRRNDQGRLYGITFVDHNSRTVLNGSQLGKRFSANVFHELFSNGKPEKIRNAEQLIAKATPKSNAITEKVQIHPLFDFMQATAEMISSMGLLDSLLLDSMAENPEELEFEYSMKKRKKRRRPRNCPPHHQSPLRGRPHLLNDWKYE